MKKMKTMLACYEKMKVCETCGISIKAKCYNGHLKMHLRQKAVKDGDASGMNCIKIGLPGRLILSKRKGLP